MNRRTVLASLNKIANQLDIEGLHNEADTVTKVMSRLAYDFEGMGEEEINGNDEYNMEDYMPFGDEDDEMEMDEDDDFDMGPESVPFDFSSPEDKDDMYGNDMKGYMDKDTDF